MRAVTFLVLICLALGSAHADNVPGIGNMHFDYYSRDPNPVHVEFSHAATQTTLAKLVAPRSYIVTAPNVRRQGRNPLPASITTDSITIAFTDPDGQSWNDSVSDHAEKMGLSLEAAAGQLRPQQYIVRLNGVANPNRRNASQASIASFERQQDRLEGLIHYKITSSDIYVGDASDAFESINCMNRLNPIYFCTYTIDISDRIVAVASFVDFRMHGGRDYANRRARFIRDVICKFTDACRISKESFAFIGDHKHRVCIQQELPQKEIVIGFSRNITPAMSMYKTHPEWFDEVKHLSWRLNVPESYRSSAAIDRPEKTVSVVGALLYPSMTPLEPIDNQLRQELSATAGEVTHPREETCAEFSYLSFEDLGQRSITVELKAPVHRSARFSSVWKGLKCGDDDQPQLIRIPTHDFDVFRACRRAEDIIFSNNEDETLIRCPIFRNAQGRCVLNFLHKGWPVSISFRAQYRSEWRNIHDGVAAMLDRMTISRDPIPSDFSNPTKH